MTQEELELIKRIRNYLPYNGGAMVNNAVYISPAQQLRNSADRMEEQQRDEQLLDELIKKYS
ncbi:MAG: hypothetical protein ACR2IQ_02790 [Minisyncoccia bacterium]